MAEKATFEEREQRIGELKEAASENRHELRTLRRQEEKYKESGFDGFLTKPIYREKLFQMMERMLGERKEEGVATDKIITQYSMREDMKRSVSILWVENNIVNQKLATALLTKAGYKVEVAGDGRAAVDRFTSSPDDFVLIFMDVQMPVMDGTEATAAIRKMGSIPFRSLP
jgi:two-component system sensor histidine kinase/response regulator